MEHVLRLGMVGGGPGAFIGEIHRLAAKAAREETKRRRDGETESGSAEGTLACHSDYVDADEAKRLQRELVQLNTAPAHNIASEDRVI